MLLLCDGKAEGPGLNTMRDWKSKKGMSQTLIAKVIAKGSGCDTGLRYGGCVGVEADAGLHSRSCLDRWKRGLCIGS